MTTDLPAATVAAGQSPGDTGLQPATARRPAPGPAPGPGGGRLAGASPAAGRLLGRLTVLPALLVMAWLLAGLPLLMLGRFTPPLMLVVSVPLAAVLLVVGLRSIPGRWPTTRPDASPGQEGAPGQEARLARRARRGGR